MSETKKSPKKRSKWIKRVIIIAVILMIAFTGYWMWTSYRDRVKAESLLQNTISVERGNIDRVIQAGGTVSYAEWITVKSPADGQVEELLVKVGDAVLKGDVILTIRNDMLEEQILTLEKDLEEVDMNLLSQSSMKISSIRSLVSGRVKGIYIDEGDDLSVVSKSTNGAILISLDDMMLVTIPANPRSTRRRKCSSGSETPRQTDT